MKKVVVAVLLAGAMMFNAGALLADEVKSQDAAIEQEIKLLRQDLRADKKKIVAANMQLTEAEAMKFWPVYDAYTVETTKLNDTLQALITEYAKNYTTLTDDKIKGLTVKTLNYDESFTKLRIEYVPIFTKAVGAKKAARFMQIDRRLAMLLNLQISSSTPLVQP